MVTILHLKPGQAVVSGLVVADRIDDFLADPLGATIGDARKVVWVVRREAGQSIAETEGLPAVYRLAGGEGVGHDADLMLYVDRRMMALGYTCTVVESPSPERRRASEGEERRALLAGLTPAQAAQLIVYEPDTYRLVFWRTT